jgi:hypothetical protein
VSTSAAPAAWLLLLLLPGVPDSTHPSKARATLHSHAPTHAADEKRMKWK